MAFYEEFRGIDEARLKLSLLNVAKADEADEPLASPEDDYLTVVRVGIIAAEFFTRRAEEIQAQATAAESRGIEVDKEELARAIGRVEGMGAGVGFAIDVLVDYAEAERLDKETGLG